MNKELDIDEIKKVLKDADMYEANLTDEELRSYYAVLKDSEATANNEEESRKLELSLQETQNFVEEEKQQSQSEQKKELTVKRWNFRKVSISSDTDDSSKPNTQDILKQLDDIGKETNDATKTVFGFNDMLDTTEEISYKVIEHNLKFIPIHCTPSFLKANTTTQAKMLYNYHSKIHDRQEQLARQSYYHAPLPKPINITNKYSSFSSENVEMSETYVSRSGRLTKRKIYYDDNSLDEVLQQTNQNKKSKNSEEEWIDKTATKKVDNKSKTTAKTGIEPSVVEESNKNDVSVDIIEEDQTSIQKNEETVQEPKAKSTPKITPKPYRKLTTSEILQRSKLFKGPSKSRAEILFDKLNEGEAKRKEDEKEREKFEKSLPPTEEIDNDSQNVATQNDSDSIIDIQDDEPFVRKRIVPPIPGRRPINKRHNTNALTPLSVVIDSPKKPKQATTNSSEEFEVGSPTRRRATQTKKNNTKVKNNPASSSQNDLRECPICSKSFPIDKIQEHAATCGDETVEIVTRTASARVSRMTCEICDTVIPMAETYEAHVKKCVKANESRSK